MRDNNHGSGKAPRRRAPSSGVLRGRNKPTGQKKTTHRGGETGSGLILNDTIALGKELGLKERKRTSSKKPPFLMGMSKQTEGHAQERRTHAPAPQKKKAPQKKSSSKKKADNLKIVPIGGLNEIGKNMTALEYRNQILIIDCGMSFPEDEMYGIDVVIPDYTYIVENAKKVMGVIITHGHEDHIGGVPYLLKKIKAPIYGTKLPLGLIKHKLEEHGLKGDLRPISAGESFKVGYFNVEAIRTTHSIADAICLCIETPAARVFHTGDFKIDYTPVDGEPIDFSKLAEIGGRGVDLLMADSTNVLRPGFTPSEKVVEETLDKIFENARKRIIIATFSSNVHRVQKIIELAIKHGRRFTVSGRSMENVVNLAIELGYLHFPKNAYVELNKANSVPDKELVIITTGSQGEPMSALSRIASGEHRNVKLKKGDMVILSSTPVPGNEKSVTNVVNRLYEKDVEVIYNDIADIHVSGHACQEELKLIHSLIKPRFFMPVHGEHRHLIRHAQLAMELGMKKDNIFVLENGDQLTLDRKKAIQFSHVISAEDIMVDGLGVGDIGSVVLKDRKQLSESGLIIIAASVDRRAGLLLSGPEIVSRGFVYMKEHEALVERIRDRAQNSIEHHLNSGSRDFNSLKSNVRDDMRRFIFSETKRSPVILPIFLEA